MAAAAPQTYPLQAGLDTDLAMAFNQGFRDLALLIQLHRDLVQMIALLSPAKAAAAAQQASAQPSAQAPAAQPVAQ